MAQQDRTFEILIIGGGVIGLAMARELHKQGVGNIGVVEKGAVGREASYAAGGMLAAQAETDRQDDFFELCRESRNLYPALAESLLDETGIDIELEQSGTFYLAFNDHDAQEIRKRYEWQKAAGLRVEQIDRRAILEAEPLVSPEVFEGLYFPDDWQVENRKLLAAFERYARLNRIRIYDQTEVLNLVTENGKLTLVETNNGLFASEKVILASGAWTSLIKAAGENIRMDVQPIRGQMIGFQMLERQLRHIIYSPQGYVIPRLDGRILAGATTEDVGFDNQTTEAGVESILKNSVEIVPSLGKLGLSDKWPGLRPYATDGLPILGAIPEIENLFVATAHYRNGILLAPITAKLMADLVVNHQSSEYLEMFGVRRFRTAKAI